MDSEQLQTRLQVDPNEFLFKETGKLLLNWYEERILQRNRLLNMFYSKSKRILQWNHMAFHPILVLCKKKIETSVLPRNTSTVDWGMTLAQFPTKATVQCHIVSWNRTCCVFSSTGLEASHLGKTLQEIKPHMMRMVSMEVQRCCQVLGSISQRVRTSPRRYKKCMAKVRLGRVTDPNSR